MVTHSGKLGQVPAWYLHNDVIQTRLKASRGCLGNGILEQWKGNPQRQFSGDVSEGIPRCLGREGGASRETGVHLDDEVL